MRGSTLAAWFVLASLSGCVAASPVSSPSSAAEAIPPGDCPTVDVHSPNGDKVNLTGRWRGSNDGGTYYLRQAGSCIWFTGLSQDTGAPGGEGVSDWTNAFFGHLGSDFVIRGWWADLPWGSDQDVGTLTMQATFAEVGDTYAVTLLLTGETGGYGGNFLVQPEEQADLQLRLREDADCLSAVSVDGDTYEIASLPPEWAVATPLQLFGPNGAVIGPSDTFAASGELARGEAFCGPGLLIFPDRIGPLAAP